MRTTTKALGLAGALLVGLTTTGCVSIETSPKPEETEAAAPAPSTDEASEPSAPAGKGSGSTEKPKDVPAKPEVPLTLNSSATYARAVQAFSPYIQLWTVDGDSIALVERNCLAKRPIDAKGTLGPDEGGVRTVTWDIAEGERNPSSEALHLGGLDDDPTSELEINDAFVVDEGMPDSYRATSDVEAQEKKFIGMCVDLGQFVLG